MVSIASTLKTSMAKRAGRFGRAAFWGWTILAALWWSLVPAAESPIAASIASATRPEGDREEDSWRDPQAVLQFLGAKPGMNVVDYFAASGYYSELLSRIVGPKGSVILYNNPQYADFAGEQLKRRTANNRLPNVRVVTAPTDEFKLPRASIDAALFVLSYHDIYWQPKEASAPFGHAPQITADLFLAMKPGGVVVVVDHAAVTGADPAKSVDALHRIDPERVKDDFKKAGFVFDGASDALRHPADDRSKLVFDPGLRHKTDQFIFRFRKPS
jgi:predicted methyltransferase